jgi:hypothetical protein
MRRLDRPTIEQHLGLWLSRMQIDGLLARRDRILALARERMATWGEDAVLYPWAGP